jgi:hypothetical protein
MLPELGAACLCLASASLLVWLALDRGRYERVFGPGLRVQYAMRRRFSITAREVSYVAYVRRLRVYVALAGVFAIAVCVAWLVSIAVRWL